MNKKPLVKLEVEHKRAAVEDEKLEQATQRGRCAINGGEIMLTRKTEEAEKRRRNAIRGNAGGWSNGIGVPGSLDMT
ncbi:hypothetical protein T06_2209 [Trichinella sp. T6]|nr:hypothetical protein T06_2209 [Trichinella sp. T6]